MCEEVKLSKEEEDAKAKDEGGKEVGEEIKLPKMKSPENAKEDKKGKKEEFVKDEAEVHPVHSEEEN